MAEVNLLGSGTPLNVTSVDLSDATAIIKANAFVVGSTDVSVKAVRLFVPAGSSAIGQELILSLWVPAVGSEALTNTPTHSALVATAVAGWNSGTLDAPVTVAAGTRVLGSYACDGVAPDIFLSTGLTEALTTTGGEYTLVVGSSTPPAQPLLAFLDSGIDWLPSDGGVRAPLDLLIETEASVFPNFDTSSAVSVNAVIAATATLRTAPLPGPTRAVPLPTNAPPPGGTLGLPLGRLERFDFIVPSAAVGVESRVVSLPTPVRVRAISATHREGITAARVEFDVTARQVPITPEPITTFMGLKSVAVDRTVPAGTEIALVLTGVSGSATDLTVSIWMEITS